MDFKPATFRGFRNVAETGGSRETLFQGPMAARKAVWRWPMISDGAIGIAALSNETVNRHAPSLSFWNRWVWKSAALGFRGKFHVAICGAARWLGSGTVATS